MEYRLLGPLEVVSGAQRIEIPPGRQRSLLIFLALRANQHVSAQVLLDELWQGTPPGNGIRAVHVLVSRLRHSLAAGADHPVEQVVSGHHGYLLRTRCDELDIAEFDRLVEEGRSLLAADEPGEALSRIDQALALWRGEPLADAAYEPFALPEIRRLEELRLLTAEERLEALLGTGQHERAVVDATALVNDQPLRMRARRLQALALYRSGRHADALAAIGGARRALDDAGLEPDAALRGLEAAILNQHEAIAAPDGAPGTSPSRTARPRRDGARNLPDPPTNARSRGRAVLLTAAAAAAAAGIGAITVEMLRGRPRDPPPTAAKAAAPLDPIIVIDPKSGKIVDRLAAGTAPSAVTVGAGAVWVLNRDDRTVARIDPKTRAVRTISVGGVPNGIAVGEGALWVTTRGATSYGLAGIASYTDTVIRVDLATLSPIATIPLPRAGTRPLTWAWQDIAVGGSGVWVIDPDRTLARIDPETNTAAVIPGVTLAGAVAAGDGAAWVIGGDDRFRLQRVDPATNTVQTITTVSSGAETLAVGGGSVWLNELNGTTWRVDEQRPYVNRPLSVPETSKWTAYGGGGFWAASPEPDAVVMVDPATNNVTRTIPLGSTPQSIAIGEGKVWVAALGSLTRQSTGAAPRGGAIPIGTCSDVVSPAGVRPRLLIASDFAVNGAYASLSKSIVDAIEFVLREHRFRAGRFTVGYQSCDSGSPDGDVPIDKCDANGRAYASTPSLVGVVGTFWSFCTYGETFFLSPAASGPVAMVGATTTGSDLTKRLSDAYQGRPPNFARVIAPDDKPLSVALQTAARLHVRRLYVLGANDDDAGFIDLAGLPPAGLRFVGRATWASRRYDAVAARVARAGADGVYLTGPLDAGTGAMIQALRRHLGGSARILAGVAATPVPELLRYAGPAAVGMYIVTNVPPYDALAKPGKRWVERFAGSEQGRGVGAYAPLAAQATEVLLAAIARSDGTRASVTRELIRTRVKDGIIGDFSFTPVGDVTPARIAVLRVVGPAAAASGTFQPDYAGAVVDRVVTVP